MVKQGLTKPKEVFSAGSECAGDTFNELNFEIGGYILTSPTGFTENDRTGIWTSSHASQLAQVTISAMNSFDTLWLL